MPKPSHYSIMLTLMQQNALHPEQLEALLRLMQVLPPYTFSFPRP